MDPRAVADHLEVIRTLMERTALYRRTLAPIMLFLGMLGIVTAFVGRWMILSAHGFVAFWLGVALLALLAAFGIARRQALAERDAFWSPPTRRVAAALAPALIVGVFVSLAGLAATRDGIEAEQWIAILPGAWMLLYGCALHAAGFFMVRGIRWLGWTFVVCGAAAFWWGLPPVGFYASNVGQLHMLMGVGFGLGQLAYGFYLRFTERKNDA